MLFRDVLRGFLRRHSLRRETIGIVLIWIFKSLGISTDTLREKNEKNRGETLKNLAYCADEDSEPPMMNGMRNNHVMLPSPATQLMTGLQDDGALDCLPLGVCLLREDWTVIFWNRCLENWSHLPRTRILGQSVFALFPSFADTEYEKCLQKIFDGGADVVLSSEEHGPLFMFEPDGGEARYQRVHITNVPSDDDGCVRAMITVEDVTDLCLQVKLYQESQERAKQELSDRRMAEAALTRLGRFHELILQSAGNGIFGLDRDGNTLFANPAAARMLGRDIEELVGERMHSILGHLCPLENGDDEQGCFLSSPLQESLYQLVTEDWFQKKDGTRFPVECLGTPIVEEGEIVGAVVTFSDISSRRFLEQEVMRYTMKLEEEVDRRTRRIRELEQRRMEVEKLAALAQVAAGVAHEINNPLAGIKNAFHLVKRAIPEAHPRAGYVGRIEKEIDRISGIIKRMYQLYQPDPAVLRAVNLRELLQDVALMVEPVLKHHDVKLKIVTPPSLPLMRLPARDITQVLCNLVQNAIQASSEKQTIRLAVETDEQGLRLIVEDQAGGISNDLLPRIFEPFFTTKSGSAQGGMGLGLSVSRSLIEALGGRIEVQTVENVGSTFIVHLPHLLEEEKASAE